MANSRQRIRILTVEEFHKRLGSPQQCVAHLLRVRWPDGVICPRCGARPCRALRSRRLYQCSRCRHQTSLTAGTIFHKSRVPLHKWFYAIYCLAQDKKGCSAMLLSKELDVCYPTAWLMAHKIRHAMAREALGTLLSGMVELDVAVLNGTKPDLPRRPAQPDRGMERKTPLLAAVETTTNGRFGRVALAAVKTLRKPRVTRFVTSTLAQGCRVRTGTLRGFQHLGSLGFAHERVEAGAAGEKGAAFSPRVHTLIGNLHRFLLGRHHAICGKHASRYLGEFAYRFNRRWHEHRLFALLLRTCVRCQVIAYPDLCAAELR